MASLKACAKKKSFQDLSTAQLSVFDDLNFFRFAPVVDGYFMPGMCYVCYDCPLQEQPVWEFDTISTLLLYFWSWFTTSGASTEPVNPAWERIRRFICCTPIQVILDH